MKHIIFALLIMLSISCSEEANRCIEDMKEEFISQNEDIGFTGIYTFELDGQTFHIFDNGVAFDAVATVLDEACNLVCTFGGFRIENNTPCDMYQDAINNATQIWP